MTKILGLDLGTNSIGWAITEHNDDTFTLLDKGVDIFQEGVARTKSGEEPMVKTRTDARALRRHYYRRRLRKIELLKVLVEHNLCPYLSTEQLNDWRYNKRYPLVDEFLLWLRSGSGDDQNPYADRYAALTQRLNLTSQADRYTLGRALYHIAQRRGFLSNRKEQSSEDDGVVKGAISKLDKDMQEADCTYLGEFYYKLFLAGEKIRTGDGYGYAGRVAHYEKEFNAICEKQNLSAELRKALYRAIFFQRPLKSQKGLVGGCTFEKGKPRCAISHPLFEEFRMWSFINNIKIKTPYDDELRMLSAEEVEQIKPLFLRKSKEHFDFEEIAKKLSGSKKNSYAHITDKVDAPYKFNFKMSQNVSGSPITAHLKDILGDEWLTTMCSLYTKGEGKTPSQILNDIWHVLFSFDNEDKLRDWAVKYLQLSEEQATTFLKIPIKQGYASLSLNAIGKILPYLREGYRYDEAVFIANLGEVVPATVWTNETKRCQIINSVVDTIADFHPSKPGETNEEAIYSSLLDCGLYGDELRMDKLYHPSKVESYKDAQPNADGLVLLGSPRTSSVRNPMAMRALFRLRALVNQLLKEGKIDKATKINIEFARGLNDANMRAAIEQYQRDNQKKRQEYADAIAELYKAECGCDITPTEDDILKYQLWVEQNKRCLYTGEQIRISEFIGSNPKFDIEHTVPRSRGGDNSQMNKTLCQSDFNRRIKLKRLPSELSNHAEVMARVEELGWQAEIEQLEKQIFGCNRSVKSAATKDAKDKAIQKRHHLRMKLDYLRGKLMRFSMTEVPEGFSNRQGVDIGIIGRYAKMYLETVFDRVYTVKGATTADFRKMWGLQEEYSRKERVNHIHHCIDAITIACIGAGTYAKWAQFQRDTERYDWHRDQRPIVEKPWPTFTEDVKAIADELLVSHHTANNLPKHTKKRMRVRGKIQRNESGEIKYIQGDSARGSLHQQTFYGAIKREDEIKYVVRKALSSLQSADVDKIVDDAVRECVKRAIAEKGFKEAMSNHICFNEEKGVYIKKVRIYTPSVTSPIHLKKHSHLSRHEHKQDYHVANDSNYCMAIYEGEVKGKIKRGFELVNNLDATLFYNGKSDNDTLVPQSKDGLPLKCVLHTGTMVLFYEKSPEEFYECTKADLVKRLYKVTGMAADGRIRFTYHQEARDDKSISAECGMGISDVDVNTPVSRLRLTAGKWNMAVEGYDFGLTVTGEIKFKHKF